MVGFLFSHSGRLLQIAFTYALIGFLAFTIELTTSRMCFADDRDDLLEAVELYFQSEKQGNVQKVWDMLASSSEFKRAYSYAFYQEMIRRNPPTLKDYKIERVLEIRDNDDKKTLPNVEKIALVQVTVVLRESGRNLAQIRVFTFLKESGKWLKG